MDTQEISTQEPVEKPTVRIDLGKPDSFPTLRTILDTMENEYYILSSMGY